MVSRPKHQQARPSSLGEVIRNSHLAQLRLAQPDELLKLARTIPQTYEIDAELGDWRAIYFSANYGEHRFERIHLLGDSLWQGISGKISSPVLAIDLATRLAVTRSGAVYQLYGKHGTGEPPAHQLHLLCAALWAWRHGERLGVVRTWF